MSESKRTDERNPYYFVKNWIAGVIPDNVPVSLCKECFCNCYDVGRTYITLLLKSIKAKYYLNKTNIPWLTDLWIKCNRSTQLSRGK